jgi:uncharacterized membrane protein HdeD (DUF308 family)
MTTKSIAKEISQRAGWSIVMGVVTAAIGVTMIVYPAATAAISTAFLGWSLLVAGVAQGIFALSSETPGNFFLKLLVGILYVVAGLALAVFPPLGVLTLTAMIGWMLVLEGILESALAFALKVGEGRGWLLVSALCSLALGVLILARWPASSAWVIGTLLGVALLTNGFMRIVVSATVRHEVREAERFPAAA